MITYLGKEGKQQLISFRPGETKLGERIQVPENAEDLEHTSANFVVIGIKEDIGIRANLGIGGASGCWEFALKSLLNVQNNQFLDGGKIAVAGALEFKDLLEEAKGLLASEATDLQRLREMTAEIDSCVSETIEKIVAMGKVPIVIGGGHNNAYGNICGTSKALKTAVNILNIDPHTDYRALEGRHSGNGFSYARKAKFLNQYAVYGLHEGYNSESILQEFETDAQLHFERFEEILMLSGSDNDEHFLHLLNWFDPSPFGLELDLDSIHRIPVSALNPSGFQLNEVRKMIRITARVKQPVYFHICEGSPGRAMHDIEREMLGKSIAYLITDFIKAYGA